MMTPGGQIDHLTFAGVYGGGGKGGGGGGSSQPAPPPTYTDPVTGKQYYDVYGPDGKLQASAQSMLNAGISDRETQAKADSAAAQAKTEQEAAGRETTFQTTRQRALEDARANAMSAFQRQGVDPNQYLESDINPVLQRQFNSIQDLDPNPYGAFPTNLGGDIVNQVLSGRRTQASNQLGQLFTPTYAQNALPDTLIDQYSGGLLDEQFNPLQTQLQNALKRHTLSDTGYGAATDLLGQKRSAASATIGNLGRGILETDRGNLNDYIGGARTTANSMNLADVFDPNVYKGGAESRVASDTANFGGALRNAIGGTKFADISELINAGGAAQGSLNPNASNPVGPTLPGGSPSSAAQDELAKSKRGLGSAGAF